MRLLPLLVLVFAAPAWAQSAATGAEVEAAIRNLEASSDAVERELGELELVREAEAFMEAYGRELIAGDRAGIADRYDRRGAYLMGRGRKLLLAHAEIAAHYAGSDWSPPAAFEWRELSYEPLGRDVVAVAGLFLWTDTAGAAPLTYSYTGLLVRQDGALRIRLEDENPAPRR